MIKENRCAHGRPSQYGECEWFECEHDDKAAAEREREEVRRIAAERLAEIERYEEGRVVCGYEITLGICGRSEKYHHTISHNFTPVRIHLV